MSSLKRKRPHANNLPLNDPRRRLPADSINPLSHGPSVLKQLRVAGLSETDYPPSTFIPGFPHRPYTAPESSPSRSPSQSPSPSDDDRSEPPPPKQPTKLRPSHQQDVHLAPLTAIIVRSLHEGNVSRAKRAFALVAHSNTAGQPVDLRRSGLWALGVEILMRDGESSPSASTAHDTLYNKFDDGIASDDGSTKGKKKPRWGSAGNMPLVKQFLESLILQYPWIRQHAKYISALDFWPVLLGAETYNIHTEQRLALEALRHEAEDWSDDDGDGDQVMMGVDGGYADSHRDEIKIDRDRGDDETTQEHERIVREKEAEIGFTALEGMLDIQRRMTSLMDTVPYSTSAKLHRIRGMVSLYIADLLMFTLPEGEEDEQDREERREVELQKARKAFRWMREHGEHLESWIEELIGVDDSDEGG